MDNAPRPRWPQLHQLRDDHFERRPGYTRRCKTDERPTARDASTPTAPLPTRTTTRRRIAARAPRRLDAARSRCPTSRMKMAAPTSPRKTSYHGPRRATTQISNPMTQHAGNSVRIRNLPTWYRLCTRAVRDKCTNGERDRSDISCIRNRAPEYFRHRSTAAQRHGAEPSRGPAAWQRGSASRHPWPSTHAPGAAT